MDQTVEYIDRLGLNEFLVITLLVLLQWSKKAKQNGMTPQKYDTGFCRNGRPEVF